MIRSYMPACALAPGLFRDSERFNRLLDFNYSEPGPCPVNPVLRDDKSRLVQEPQPNKGAHGRTHRTSKSRVAFITVMLGTHTSSASRSPSSSSTSRRRQTSCFATLTLPRIRCGGTLTSCGGTRALSQGPQRLGLVAGLDAISRHARSEQDE